MPDEVAVASKGPVTIVTLQNERRLNALSGLMRKQLEEALTRITQDGECRAIVLTGAERGFLLLDDEADDGIALDVTASAAETAGAAAKKAEADDGTKISWKGGPLIEGKGGWSFSEAPGGAKIDYDAEIEVNAIGRQDAFQAQQIKHQRNQQQHREVGGHKEQNPGHQNIL